jgi:hypothetical protein
MNFAIVRLCVCACLLALSFAAQAQSKVSYTFVDLGYQNLNADVDGDGFRTEGSLGINDYFHTFANFESTSLDDGTIDDGMGGTITVANGDLNIWGVGAGIHSPVTSGISRGYQGLTDRFSFFLNGQYLSADLDNGPDPNGWAFDTGFRSVNSSRVEFIGKVGYQKFENIDGEFTVDGRLLFRVIGNVQIQTGINWNDNATRWFLGARYDFGGWQLFD